MNGRYLLDTNIIIAFFGSELVVKNNLVQANEVFIPIPVLQSGNCVMVRENQDVQKRI